MSVFAASRRVVLAAALVSYLGACSFVHATGPSPQYRELGNLDCTPNVMLPVTDTVIVGGTALSLAASLAASTLLVRERGNADILGYVITMLGFGSSAVYGYLKTSACRRARADFLQSRQAASVTLDPSGQSPSGPAVDR